ncbi:hypothetical protein ACNKHS_01820 [Shigella flexneri]
MPEGWRSIMPASHLASGVLTPTKKPQIISVVLSRYTSRIEPLSLDEAYPHVTDSVAIARRFRDPHRPVRPPDDFQ